ncbi:hypothetical protein KFL_000100010, partial [Klebsormidium nitens]
SIGGPSTLALTPAPTSTLASIWAAKDVSILGMPSNPLFRVYCSYTVTISGAPATSLTVCTYNATGALVTSPTATVPGGTPPTPTVSCPRSTAPNSCPASVQLNFALANARAFFQQTLCNYAVAVLSGASALCAYDATCASKAGNAANCPRNISGPPTPAPTPALTLAPTQPLTGAVAAICPATNMESGSLNEVQCGYAVNNGAKEAHRSPTPAPPIRRSKH